MFPVELVIRGPVFPKVDETPKPDTEFRLLSAVEVERMLGIEPPTAFALPLNPGFPTTLIPLLGTPECP